MTASRAPEISRGRKLPARGAFFLCVVALATPVLANQLEPGADPWFALHAFVGSDGCLAVQEGQRLEQGDRILVFAAGKPASVRRIAYLVSADSAKRIFEERGFDGVYSDKELWNRIGCYWGLRGAFPLPPSIARYEIADSGGEGLPLAIEGLPSSAVVLSGEGSPLAPRELGALDRRLAVSVPKAFLQGKVLRAGRRYGSGRGRELIEVFLGKPADNAHGAGAPIDSIQICHVFVNQRRVLCVDRFSRISGEEEHVDLEPPQLDESNWFLISEETLGYLSLDGGATWDRLSIDVGFEGISWAISRLEEGLPRLWEFYLYTRH